MSSPHATIPRASLASDLVAANFTPELKKILQSHGCSFKRQGKGDHELWFSPISAKTFVVDNGIKSRHTANGVLKQAGIDKAF
nr:type II toxin-antitoxin system HicA family toxin [Thioalkalivibrio thiocyanoxidans]